MTKPNDRSPVYIPQALYDRAVQEGYDVTGYEPTRAIPMTPSEAYHGGPRLLARFTSHDAKTTPGVTVRGGVSYPKFAPSNKRPWPCPGEKR